MIEAGRKLDMIIAEKVFERDINNARIDPMNRNGEPQYFWGYPLGHDFALNYSTEISAAWEVVEKMMFDGRAVDITRNGKTGEPLDDWEVCFPKGESPYITMASAATVPLAICLAALKAIGEPIEPEKEISAA